MIERRRVRLGTMARELEISERKFREIFVLGMPYTQLQGIIWFEPSEVHEWLDKFHHKRRVGIKRERGLKLGNGQADETAAPPTPAHPIVPDETAALEAEEEDA